MSNPKPSTVPTNTRKGILGIRKLTVQEINAALVSISLRINQLDAVSQNPDMKGRKIVNVLEGENPADAVTLGQVSDAISVAGQGLLKHYFFMGT